MKKEVLILFFAFLYLFNFVQAGPYGYGDSMNLHKELVDGKIVYGYGDGAKYVTSLKPKDLNWTEWKKKEKIIKSEKLELTWKEIAQAVKDKHTIEELLVKQKNTSVLTNSPPASIADFLLRLISTKIWGVLN